VLIAATAFAAKTDVVVLKNGDRITGEVKELNRGPAEADHRRRRHDLHRVGQDRLGDDGPAVRSRHRERRSLRWLKRELFKDFLVVITAYDMFDSEPQVVGVSRNDFGVSFSIGWTF